MSMQYIMGSVSKENIRISEKKKGIKEPGDCQRLAISVETHEYQVSMLVMVN
jgi:hypothetical protein